MHLEIAHHIFSLCNWQSPKESNTLTLQTCHPKQTENNSKPMMACHGHMFSRSVWNRLPRTMCNSGETTRKTTRKNVSVDQRFHTPTQRYGHSCIRMFHIQNYSLHILALDLNATRARTQTQQPNVQTQTWFGRASLARRKHQH